MKNGISGYIVGVISILVSVFVSWHFYDKSQQFRIPIYAVDRSPSTVLDFDEKKDSLPLKVSTTDGQSINEDIYLATHYFWNMGQKPILSTDILEPLRVHFDPEEITILEASISNSSRGVVSCELLKIDDSTFQITHRILESNDGCSVDYLYIGKRIPSVNITGEIVGVKEIKLSLKTWESYFKNLSYLQKLNRFIPALIMTLIFAILLSMYFKRFKMRPSRRAFRVILLTLLFAELAILLEVKFDGSLLAVDFEYPDLQHWVTNS